MGGQGVGRAVQRRPAGAGQWTATRRQGTSRHTHSRPAASQQSTIATSRQPPTLADSACSCGVPSSLRPPLAGSNGSGLQGGASRLGARPARTGQQQRQAAAARHAGSARRPAPHAPAAGGRGGAAPARAAPERVRLAGHVHGDVVVGGLVGVRAAARRQRTQHLLCRLPHQLRQPPVALLRGGAGSRRRRAGRVAAGQPAGSPRRWSAPAWDLRHHRASRVAASPLPLLST